eukprot:SM000191S05228  [mRNA]  locus=s191:198646:201372:+ [translate_table: standard]
MVKNKGFLPSSVSEVNIQRKQLKAIINSTWDACTAPDTVELGAKVDGASFTADAILANPPTLGHIHIAEKLQIPLHVFFTMPWTATKAYPHPLARVTQVAGFENRVSSPPFAFLSISASVLNEHGRSSAASSLDVYGIADARVGLLQLSYAVVDNLLWMGSRDLINNFRKKKLRLKPITYLSGGQVLNAKVPTGYIWSPSLAPKPKDWGSHIDVVGFCFLKLAGNYKPPEDLMAFFAKGPAPIYVGFGSLPVQDPHGMTKTIVEALTKTGQRGIIQKGWGGLGEMDNPPEHIHLLGNCPHDWLFPRCLAVVHHGGAGTTAAGLLAACPTTIVPFFGDQPFWGDRCHATGVGPEPIPIGQFNLNKLVNAIEYMLDPKVKEAATVMSEKLQTEDGVGGAVKAFHKHLPKGITPGIHSKDWLAKRQRRLAVRHKLMKAVSCISCTAVHE